MDKYIQPDFSSSALITIDTQKDTLDGQPLEIPGTSAILPAMLNLLDVYRKKALPIIHIVRIYKTDASNVDLCRKKAVENGKGTELAEELFPHGQVKLNSKKLLSGGIQEIMPNEVIIYKPRWGAFYNTPLEQYLRKKESNYHNFYGLQLS